MNSTALSALLIAAVLSLLSLAAGCSDDESSGSDDKSSVARTAGDRAPALTSAMREEFGAATWAPADSSYFGNSLRLKEQWTAIRDSEAVRLLLELPTVQMALGELERASAQMQQMPMASAGLEVLKDAFSREVFVCLDDRWAGFVSALAGIYGEIYIQSVLSGLLESDVDPLEAAVSALLDYEEELRIPGTLVGFRLADPARARKLLAELIVMAKDMGLPPLADETIGDGKFHVLRLDGGTLLAPWRTELQEGLEAMGMSPDAIARFTAWINSQTLAVAVGLRGDYLLLSIGADTKQLAALGSTPSLAESKDFEPIRRRYKPGVVSLSYLCAELTSEQKLDVDQYVAYLDRVLALTADELPGNLAPRLRKDARALLNDINETLPEAQSQVGVSFLNRGFESYTFKAALAGVMDASRPLSILSSAGPSPLLALAGRSQSSQWSYDRVAHWFGVAYGYFEEFAVPMIPKRDRAKFDRFEKTFIPAIRQIHETTKNDLIPAVDACQGLFVLDGGGQVSAIPGGSMELPRPLRYPRPAFVLEINDAKKLTSAFSSYREIFNRFITTMAKGERELKGFEWPPPDSRPFRGGTLYSYPLPIPPELALMPNVVVTKDRVVLAIAEDHSAALLKSSAVPGAGVVDLSAPAGAASWIDIAGLVELLFDDAEIVLEALAAEGGMETGTVELVRGHFPVARKVLGVFKSYTSRTWVEEDTAVCHSWLHIEDAAK